MKVIIFTFLQSFIPPHTHTNYIINIKTFQLCVGNRPHTNTCTCIYMYRIQHILFFLKILVNIAFLTYFSPVFLKYLCLPVNYISPKHKLIKLVQVVLEPFSENFLGLPCLWHPSLTSSCRIKFGMRFLLVWVTWLVYLSLANLQLVILSIKHSYLTSFSIGGNEFVNSDISTTHTLTHIWIYIAVFVSMIYIALAVILCLKIKTFISASPLPKLR